MAYDLKKRKTLFERKSLIYIWRCARLPIHSSSQVQGKTTQSVNFTTVSRIPLKTDFFTGKMIVTASKGSFSDFCGETSTHIEKTESASK